VVFWTADLDEARRWQAELLDQLESRRDGPAVWNRIRSPTNVERGLPRYAGFLLLG
jgi:hypothetical protein